MSKKSDRKIFIKFLNQNLDSNMIYKKFDFILKDKNPMLFKILFSKNFLKLACCFLFLFINVIIVTCLSSDRSVLNKNFNQQVISELNYNHFSPKSNPAINQLIEFPNLYSLYEITFQNKIEERYIYIDKYYYNFAVKKLDQFLQGELEDSNLNQAFSPSLEVIDGKIIYILDFFKDELGLTSLDSIFNVLSNQPKKVEFNNQVCIYKGYVSYFDVIRNYETGEYLNITKSIVFQECVMNEKNKFVQIKDSFVNNYIANINERAKFHLNYASIEQSQICIFIDKTIISNQLELDYANKNNNFKGFNFKFSIDKNLLILQTQFSMKDEFLQNFLFNSYHSPFGIISKKMQGFYICETYKNNFYEQQFSLDKFLEFINEDISFHQDQY